MSRHWNVINSGVAAFNANSTFNYLAGDLQGGATDSEMLSGGGHKTRGVLSIYTKRTNPQAINLARKRLELRTAQRTKGGNLSE